MKKQALKMNDEELEIIRILKRIMNIDSPTGYAYKIINYIAQFAKEQKLDFEITKKGNLNIHFKSKNQNAQNIYLTAHVDTLGFVVSAITNSGQIKITPVGAPLINTLNGEYIKLYTRDNRIYEGTLVSNTPSIHVFDNAKAEVKLQDLNVRLDYHYENKNDLINMGINHGDFVCYDPKFRVSKAGYINSRFLDDKAIVAVFLAVIKKLKQSNIDVKNNITFAFSTYEEVGHGMSYVPENIDQLIAVDMACVGDNLNGSEQTVTICTKDTGSPYDYQLTTQLMKLATKAKIDAVYDVYPHYGSDATAANRGGANCKTALIGPGVAASHGMERTHINSLSKLKKFILEIAKNH